jgi:hypothetical protein
MARVLGLRQRFRSSTWPPVPGALDQEDPVNDLWEPYECPFCEGYFPYNQFILVSSDVWGVSPTNEYATRYSLGDVFKYELCARRVWVRQRYQPPPSM